MNRFITLATCLAPCALASLVGFAWAPPANAEGTLELRVSGPEEVFKGDPKSTSVDARGVIGMGPISAELADLEDAPVVALARDGKNIYAATSGGGLYRIGPDGKKTVVLAAGKRVVTAVATHKGAVYSASGPDGQIHKGGATLGKTKEKYVWALLS